MKLVNWLNPLVDWLWNNKNYIIEQRDNNIERPGDRFGFEVFYPEYGGIPDEISQYLSNKHCDILSKYTISLLESYPDKNKFGQKICNELTNSTVIFEDTCEFIKE
jgi:hypothetical protein